MSEAQVFAAASGDTALLDEVDDFGIDGGDVGGLELCGHPGLAAEVTEVAEKAEASDIGASAGQSGGGDGGTGKVELSHLPGDLGFEFGRANAALDGGRDDAGAEWFGEKEEVAGFRSGV